MTDCCEQVALTLEKVARIVRCLGQESMIGNEVLAEVPAPAVAALESPKARKAKAPRALPNPDKPRKKPGRKPKSESSGDATGPRGQGTVESSAGIKTTATGPVRPRIIAYLRRVGTADVAMIVAGTGLERLQVTQALKYGMSQGAFVTPQTGFWKVDPDYEG